jgi:hypothetical protein
LAYQLSKRILGKEEGRGVEEEQVKFEKKATVFFTSVILFCLSGAAFL